MRSKFGNGMFSFSSPLSTLLADSSEEFLSDLTVITVAATEVISLLSPVWSLQHELIFLCLAWPGLAWRTEDEDDQSPAGGGVVRCQPAIIII